MEEDDLPALPLSIDYTQIDQSVAYIEVCVIAITKLSFTRIENRSRKPMEVFHPVGLR